MRSGFAQDESGDGFFKFRRFWRARVSAGYILARLIPTDRFVHVTLYFSSLCPAILTIFAILAILAIRFGSFSLVATIDGSQAIMPILL
jgi:hypothetical protein